MASKSKSPDGRRHTGIEAGRCAVAAEIPIRTIGAGHIEWLSQKGPQETRSTAPPVQWPGGAFASGGAKYLLHARRTVHLRQARSGELP